jgi:hypothetical protein
MAAMEPTRARVLAERAHWRDREPDGTTLLAHIRRVVAAAPPEAHTVAWLHESLESGRLSEHELVREGLGTDELMAVHLLSRRSGSHSDHVYLAHLDAIVRAPGRSGQLARAVKAADLADRCAHPRVRADGWSPPYARALERLLEAGGTQLVTPTRARARPRVWATHRVS